MLLRVRCRQGAVRSLLPTPHDDGEGDRNFGEEEAGEYILWPHEQYDARWRKSLIMLILKHECNFYEETLLCIYITNNKPILAYDC